MEAKYHIRHDHFDNKAEEFAARCAGLESSKDLSIEDALEALPVFNLLNPGEWILVSQKTGVKIIIENNVKLCLKSTLLNLD